MTINQSLPLQPPSPPTQPRRALLLANVRASRVADQLPQAIAQLQADRWELSVENPGAAAELSDLIARYREHVDCVIVAGGDGTINAVADALVHSELPVGILPLGTANDLARTLGLPLPIEQACRVITDGYQRRIDLGCVNGKHFVNAASLGLSVQITRQLDQDAKKRWGWLAYALTTAKVLWQLRPFRAEISDGQTNWKVKTVQITIGNGRFFGGGMTVDEQAAIDDQLLNLYSIEIQHWWELPLLLWSLRRGRLSHLATVRTLQGQYFEIRTRRSRRINTDGELTVRTPATFRTVPRALILYVPQGAPDDARTGLSP